MKIVFAALYDPRDFRRGSGTYAHLVRALEEHGNELVCLAAPPVARPFSARLRGRLSRFVGRRHRFHEDPAVAERHGRALARRLPKTADLLLTNDFGIAACTPSPWPVMLYTDSAFPRPYSENANPRLDGLAPWSVFAAQRLTAAALRRARWTVLASHWAREVLARYPTAHPERLEVVPLGANLDPPPGPEEAAARRGAKLAARSRIELLFVGADWSRKQGDVALRVVGELRRRGFDAVLNIVGPTDLPLPPDAPAVVHPPADKTDPGGQRQLDAHFRRADVFLLPSLAEGFGVVFAEAAAYGLPSLAYATTGVTTAVADGESGLLLPPGSPPGAFADVVEGWLADPASYDRLVAGARRHFETTVNWPTAAAALMGLVAGEPTP